MYSYSVDFSSAPDGALTGYEDWEGYPTYYNGSEGGATLPACVVVGGFASFDPTATAPTYEGAGSSQFDRFAGMPLHADFDLTATLKLSQPGSRIAAIAILIGESEGEWMHVEVYTNGANADSARIVLYSLGVADNSVTVAATYGVTHALVWKRRGDTFEAWWNGALVSTVSFNPTPGVVTEQRLSLEPYRDPGSGPAPFAGIGSISIERVEATSATERVAVTALDGTSGTVTADGGNFPAALASDDGLLVRGTSQAIVTLSGLAPALPETSLITEVVAYAADASLTLTSGTGTRRLRVIDPLANVFDVLTRATNGTSSAAGEQSLATDMTGAGLTGADFNAGTVQVRGIGVTTSWTVDRAGYFDVTRDLAVPAAPVVSATAISSSRIDLTWTVAPADITGLTVEWSSRESFVNNSTYFTTSFGSASVAAGATGYSVTGLSAGTTYYFRVRATNASGDSDNSTMATASTSPVLGSRGGIRGVCRGIGRGVA